MKITVSAQLNDEQQDEVVISSLLTSMDLLNEQQFLPPAERDRILDAMQIVLDYYRDP